MVAKILFWVAFVMFVVGFLKSAVMMSQHPGESFSVNYMAALVIGGTLAFALAAKFIGV